ncbi:MAG: hypothetical protein GY729_09580, partial [Desulfobacteraceae bacterium]|nr:hypothetical protein [Desulfobacteraceae bacterium]
MNMSCKRVSAFCFFLFIAGCLSGCGESKETAEPEYFLKSDRMIITKTDFAEELELKKAAYPYNIKESVPEYNEMVIDLVRVLSEEIVLLSFAKDQSIIVSKQELLEAENEIRQDYPDKSF